MLPKIQAHLQINAVCPKLYLLFILLVLMDISSSTSIQTAYKLLELFQKLKDLGHPLYLATDSVATIPCSTAKSEVEAQVQLSQMLLGAWTQEVADLRTRCHWLLYLNMPKLLQLYHLLHLQGAAGPTRVDNIVHEVSFLAPNTEMERKKLRARVEVGYVYKFVM